MKTYERQFKSYLKEKKLKLTPERKIILSAILSFHGHFDVDGLYEKIRAEGKNLSRATIYRAMPLFIESGFIREILNSRGKASYEHIFGHEHHDHLLCIKCGRIIEFKEDKIEELQEEVCKKYDFEPVEHRLGIRGYCNKCRNKKKQERQKLWI
ncbi:transcriptional repressor [Candidatus Desantisbacteria bacterium CG_4_10_14_0_8_um_filter_48_22]|uniref:Transcriptional repressor n=1 Tax=Candidatus Desantisbacteria bacterium CG_4_10_14_0_8_um_filter_48_22 TaxID=1974543 RepID=A0A2M7S730_9BACT|nr:MAG: transcriptional repressor [Candidatus Desantisbacteria bacterium CG02_land_8_20_14_3_00_49_13]PIZ15143.1 MAG: transcriptional repressor [Candidatus Desantisbacteria bacterium CG_4_10_14_0_8_um_filter_48_22]